MIMIRNSLTTHTHTQTPFFKKIYKKSPNKQRQKQNAHSFQFNSIQFNLLPQHTTSIYTDWLIDLIVWSFWNLCTTIFLEKKNTPPPPPHSNQIVAFCCYKFFFFFCSYHHFFKHWILDLTCYCSCNRIFLH